jgi:hypothetical protein
MMGFKKNEDGRVTNSINGRYFNFTDAEHFLCKAWLNAKITFANYRVIQYPKQCNSSTHPSPVLHRLNNEIIGKIIRELELAYVRCKDNCSSTKGLQLPFFCRLPGEQSIPYNTLTVIAAFVKLINDTSTI